MELDPLAQMTQLASQFVLLLQTGFVHIVECKSEIEKHSLVHLSGDLGCTLL